MAYRLRFVQRFDKKDMDIFLELERKFIEWEKSAEGIVPGRRFVPVSGRDPVNTLIYEADVPEMEDVMALMRAIDADEGHSALVEQQGIYMKDYYVEILRELQ